MTIGTLRFVLRYTSRALAIVALVGIGAYLGTIAGYETAQAEHFGVLQ